MSVRGKAIFFETQWAVKTSVFLGKFFATCKLEGWAKSVQKEGATEIFNSSNFLQTWPAKV
jgi:hypothetical protein